MNIFQDLWKQAQVTLRLLRDPRVAMWKKTIPFLPLIYVVSPLNLLSSWIPVIGQIDDVALFLAAMRLFEKMADSDLVIEHEAKVS